MLSSSDIYSLINYASFVEALFIGMSVGGLLILRVTRPTLKRPIKVRGLASVKMQNTRKVFDFVSEFFLSFLFIFLLSLHHAAWNFPRLKALVALC